MMINMVLKAVDIPTKVIKNFSGLFSLGQFTYLHAKDINGVLQGYDGTKLVVKAPSEHTIDGTQYDLELQFYHEIKSEFTTTETD